MHDFSCSLFLLDLFRSFFIVFKACFSFKLNRAYCLWGNTTILLSNIVFLSRIFGHKYLNSDTLTNNTTCEIWANLTTEFSNHIVMFCVIIKTYSLLAFKKHWFIWPNSSCKIPKASYELYPWQLLLTTCMTLNGKISLSSNLLTIYHVLVSECPICGYMGCYCGLSLCLWAAQPYVSVACARDGWRAGSFLGVQRESQLLSSNPHKQGAATTSHSLLSPPLDPLGAAAGGQMCTAHRGCSCKWTFLRKKKR